MMDFVPKSDIYLVI